jgi:hypothetical protein
VCVKRVLVSSSELDMRPVQTCPLSVAAWSFYSTRSGHYTKTWGPTGGPEVVGSWYPIQQLGY